MTQHPASARDGIDRLRVALDVTALWDRPTGIGSMVGELAARLGQHPSVDLAPFAVSLRGRRDAPAAAAWRPIPARLARAVWSRSDLLSVRWWTGRADIVHGPNYVVPPGGGAVEVITVSDLSALHYPEMVNADVAQWPALLRRRAGRGAWIHTISRFVADEVRDAFPEFGDRVVPVPLGFRPPPPVDDRSDGRRGRMLAGGDRYIVAVGTIEPRKDLDGVIEAFELLAADDVGLRLVLAGPDGSDSERIGGRIRLSPVRDRIVRTGWLSSDDRWAVLRGAAAVVYASHYEGFGFVPLEAVSVGTPVVATAVGAVPEVLGDGGLLVPPGDRPALAAAIQRMLTDRELAEAMVSRGAAMAAGYDWDETVDGLVRLYRQAREG